MLKVKARTSCETGWKREAGNDRGSDHQTTSLFPPTDTSRDLLFSSGRILLLRRNAIPGTRHVLLQGNVISGGRRHLDKDLE